MFSVQNADENLTLLEILVTSMNQYEAPNSSQKIRGIDSAREKRGRRFEDDDEGNFDVI